MTHLKSEIALFSILLAFAVCSADADPPEAAAVPDAELRAFTLHSSQPTSTRIEWNPQAVRQAAVAAQPVRVLAFPMTAGRSVDLELTPFSITGSKTRFVLGRLNGPDEPLDFDPRTLSLFHGIVSGHPGSRVFLALSEHLVTGLIDLGGEHERYRVTSKDEAGRELAPGRLTLFKTSSIEAPSSGLPPGVPLCGVEDDVPPADLPIKGISAPTVGLKQMELAVDTDLEFFQLFNDPQAAAAYLVALYAEVGVIFQRDVNVWVDLVFARIWTEPDPFDSSNPLPEFRDYWNANMGSVHRDIAQMLSGRRNYPFGGQASLSVLCSGSSGYSVVGYAVGFFPDPSQPSPYHHDLTVTAHELGHTAGTGHTHSNGIDDCDDPTSTPQRGTIMAYCGQTFTGLNANRDPYFHRVIRQNINSHVAASSCIVADCNKNGIADALDLTKGSLDNNTNGVPDECEDCNNNGVLDNLDILAGSADVDGNAIPDECEADCNNNNIPDAFDIAQGTSMDAYGNGLPDECEINCNGNDISDYTEIQLNMELDIDRNALLDRCQDCDTDGTGDLTALAGAHSLWMGTGEQNAEIRRFYASSGVLTLLGTALVNETQDVLVTPDGRVLVTGAADHRVMEFDLDGTYQGDLVASGSGGLSYPTGLLLLPGGSTLLVASRDTNSVLAYAAVDGTFQNAFVSAGSGGLTAPFGLTLDRFDDLYVTSGNNEVLRYNGTTGAFVETFVSAAANGTLDQPRGLTFKGDGNLLVASLGSDEVLEFDGQDGTPLGKWAQVGTSSVLTQTHPWGIRVGPNGNVYVARTGEDHDHVTASPVADPRKDTAALHLTDAAIYEFDVANGNFVRTHIGGAGHGMEFPTAFDFIPGWQIDCNFNLLPDSCDIASGTSLDLDLSGVPDECEIDCNSNGILDRLDIIPFGASFDVNADLVPDECDTSFADGFESGDTSAWSATVGK